MEAGASPGSRLVFDSQRESFALVSKVILIRANLNNVSFWSMTIILTKIFAR